MKFTHLIAAIIIILIMVGIAVVPVNMNNTIGAPTNTYKITAYNGQEYDFVTQKGDITAVRFSPGLDIKKHIDGTPMPIMVNGKKSSISVVFGPDGKFLGIEEVTDTANLQGISSVDKIKAGAESVNTGYGFTF